MRGSSFFSKYLRLLPALAAIFLFCRETPVYAQLATLPEEQTRNQTLVPANSPDTLSRLTLVGEAVHIKQVIDILNAGLPLEYAVVALEIQERPGYFTLQLSGAVAQQQTGPQENIILCIINNLTNPANPYEVKIKSNTPNILIGSAGKATIDIGDIAKFDKFAATSDSLQYSAINILIHEFYEQYHLQVLSGVKPEKAKSKQIVRAHNYASQKEANYFNTTYTKTTSKIYDEYLLVEFESKVNRVNKVRFIVNHQFGNITTIERSIIGLPRS